MAYEIANNAVKVSMPAGADLSAKQYYFVKLNASAQVILCAAATDIPFGVLQNSPTSGQPAEVVVVGGTKVVCGAAIATAAVIGTDSAGKADAKTAGTDTTEYAVGLLILASAADGDVATAVINCASPNRAA